MEAIKKYATFINQYFFSKVYIANIIFSEELKVKINFIFAYALF